MESQQNLPSTESDRQNTVSKKEKNHTRHQIARLRTTTKEEEKIN